MKDREAGVTRNSISEGLRQEVFKKVVKELKRVAGV